MTNRNEAPTAPIMSRRAFVKGTSALAAGTALASGFGFDIAHAEGTVDPTAPVETRHTYCDMCNHVPKCGITAYVQDDKIVRIESRDPHPVTPLCAKGLASIQELYDPSRLQTPMRRTNPKGTGTSSWEPISWDEAYAIIAAEFNRVKTKTAPMPSCSTAATRKSRGPPCNGLLRCSEARRTVWRALFAQWQPTLPRSWSTDEGLWASTPPTTLRAVSSGA